MQNISTAETERIPIFDLCVSPNKIREQIKSSKPIVLTDNDDPVAVVIHVNASTVEDTLRELRFLQMRTAVRAIQEASLRSGLSEMTLEEINAEIDAARAERRAKKEVR